MEQRGKAPSSGVHFSEPGGNERLRKDFEKPKKAYERPRILFREKLEAVAAVCTPSGKSNPVDCPTGPINS